MSNEPLSDRFWNQSHKALEEERRELLFMDDIIQKAHLDRQLDALLDGIQTVFDGGAGVGRFSLDLAGRGLRVVHYDISQPMIDRAREKAKQLGVAESITFVQGGLEHLSQFEDGEFDLVLSVDAPISYTYPNHESVVRELVRIARRAVVLGVSSRLGYIPYQLNPTPKKQYLVDENSDEREVRSYRRSEAQRAEGWTPKFRAILAMLENGLAEPVEPLQRAFDQGGTPWPPNYLFLPEELKSLLVSSGLSRVRCAGPGALSRSIPGPILRRLLSGRHREQFLDLCYKFDSQESVAGLGKDNLVASGTRS